MLLSCSWWQSSLAKKTPFKNKLQGKPFKAALGKSKDELIKNAVGTVPEDKFKPLKNRLLVNLLWKLVKNSICTLGEQHAAIAGITEDSFKTAWAEEKARVQEGAKAYESKKNDTAESKRKAQRRLSQVQSKPTTKTFSSEDAKQDDDASAQPQPGKVPFDEGDDVQVYYPKVGWCDGFVKHVNGCGPGATYEVEYPTQHEFADGVKLDDMRGWVRCAEECKGGGEDDGWALTKKGNGKWPEGTESTVLCENCQAL